LLLAAPVWAQTVPDAGALQQQLQRELQAPVGRLEIPAKDKPQVDLPPSGPTVVVKNFKFTGNTLLGDEPLRAALAHLLGRPLVFAQLQSSAVTVADLYRDKGWVVQTFLPEQDLDEGELTIAIREAVFGTTQIAGTPPTRVSTELVLAIIDQQAKTGAHLNKNALDRALLLADDLPGVAVSGSLAQGQFNAQTDLVLQLADEPWASGSVSIDNTGVVSTGSSRANLALSLASPSGHGDEISLHATATQGSRYGRIAYSVPLGLDGWRVGINTSHLGYALISEAYQSLNASGSTNTAGLELRYPVVRSRSFNLSTSFTFDKKDYLNVSGGATSSAYRATPLAMGLNANSVDALGGGGANTFFVGVTAGQLNLNGSPTQLSDASTTQTAGAYSKVRYALGRQQQLGTASSLYAALSGQWSGNNLDSSEKFYLGGASGVRAYPSSEGGGSLGQLLNVELHWQLREGVNLAVFYDYGRVVVNTHNDFSGANALNDYGLQGAGLTLQWRSTSGLAMQATYARRIGDNPNPITTDANRGADQDGTLYRDRLWLAASLAF
jgi:hemolysin activation/secretion protein